MKKSLVSLFRSTFREEVMVCFLFVCLSPDSVQKRERKRKKERERERERERETKR